MAEREVRLGGVIVLRIRLLVNKLVSTVNRTIFETAFLLKKLDPSLRRLPSFVGDKASSVRIPLGKVP